MGSGNTLVKAENMAAFRLNMSPDVLFRCMIRINYQKPISKWSNTQ